MKTCTKCGVEKPLSEFAKHNKSPDGLQWWCRKCNSKRVAEWRREDKVRYPEKWKAKKKKRHVKEKYGLTVEQYDSVISKQKCEICETTEARRFHLDHCHKTGKVRGCLCENCNLGIGKFKDKPELFVNVLMYLNRYK